MIIYILCVGVSALLRDDHDSYARVLLHEIYNQDTNMDIVYCGASHVSHGIKASLADSIYGGGYKNFSLGTPSQSIQGTYAILRQAVKLYDIKRAFLELDFAVSTRASVKEKIGFSADNLVAKYIKNPKIKFDFIVSTVPPKYYISEFLPIGKDKFMTLRPQTLFSKAKEVFSGKYFKYTYYNKNDVYDGKGCLLDLRTIKNGTFSNYYQEQPINVKDVSEDWENTVDKIIALCKENNIELIMYSMPCSDFYLHEKGNYNEYYDFVKTFCAERGFEYYDFNLAKEKYLLLEDEDFFDDNHLNKQGVYKYTEVMCNYFTGKLPQDDMFHSSYAEKIAAQEDRIYGLVLEQSEDKKSITITPVVNHVDTKRITYDIKTIVDKNETIVATNTSKTEITLPKGQSGKLQVTAYPEGKQTNVATEHFPTF